MGNKRKKTYSICGAHYDHEVGGGYNHVFWRKQQQGKKTYTNNLESGKLLGMAVSMYHLYGIQDAMLCQCDELDSVHHLCS